MAATHLAGTETDLYREAEERVVIKKEERALSTATDKSNKESHCNSGNRNNNSNTVLGAVHLRLYPLGSVQLQSLQFRCSRGDRILLPLAAAVTTHAKKKKTRKSIERTNIQYFVVSVVITIIIRSPVFGINAVVHGKTLAL